MAIPIKYERQRLGNLGYRVLGLDLDGVCADYTQGFRQFCAERMELPLSMFPTPTDYSLVASGWPFKSTSHYLAMHREAVEDGLYARLPAYDGVSEALQELSQADVHIRVVSHRLFVAGLHRRVVRDTAEWLDSWEIPYMSLCLTGLKDSVDANVYIEDSPAMIQALRAASRTVITFDQPYNRVVTGQRICEWASAPAAILAIMDDGE